MISIQGSTAQLSRFKEMETAASLTFKVMRRPAGGGGKNYNSTAAVDKETHGRYLNEFEAKAKLKFVPSPSLRQVQKKLEVELRSLLESISIEVTDERLILVR